MRIEHRLLQRCGENYRVTSAFEHRGTLFLSLAECSLNLYRNQKTDVISFKKKFNQMFCRCYAYFFLLITKHLICVRLRKYN